MQPIIDSIVIATCIEYQHIERATGEEKLMGAMVKLLPAKIPNIDAKAVIVG